MTVETQCASAMALFNCFFLGAPDRNWIGYWQAQRPQGVVFSKMLMIIVSNLSRGPTESTKYSLCPWSWPERALVRSDLRGRIDRDGLDQSGGNIRAAEDGQNTANTKQDQSSFQCRIQCG